MTTDNRRSIVLYNHATGTGHHESWTAMFAALLLQQGCRVACITPNPIVLQEVLKTQGCSLTDSLYFLSIPEIISPPATVWQRLKEKVCNFIRLFRKGDCSGVCDTVARAQRRSTLWEVWRSRSHMYAKHLPEVRVSPDLPLAIRLKRRFLHALIPPVWHVECGVRTALRIVCSQRYETGSRYPANLVVSAILAQNSLPWRPDFLLVMYADLLMTRPSFWQCPEARMPIPWGGIRFAPPSATQMGEEGYFLDPMFRGLCFLDEQAVPRYRARHKDRHFEFLPDIVNSKVSPFPVSICEELQRAAKGRPIVLLCGSIESRKNIRLFCEMAIKSDTNSFFFALIGQLHPFTYTKADHDALERFINEAGDRSFLRDIYFADEREMNSVIQISDVIFAVYRDFKISSNMLGKAAHFCKPILVSNRYLMGRRVKEYGIGRVVEEDDVSAMIEELNKTIQYPISKEIFDEYKNNYSIDKMGVSIERFVNNCMESA